jgi:hypothetical protein
MYNTRRLPYVLHAFVNPFFRLVRSVDVYVGYM